MRKKSSKVKISRIFILCFFFAFIAAIVKLVYVAISPTVDGINLTTLANDRQTVKKTLYASRGNIYDVNGDVIAQNVNSYTLIAYLSDSRTTNANDPKHVVDKVETAKKLSECLDMDYDYVLTRLNYNGYQVEFGIKGKNLSENKKKEIEALNLPGIDFIVGSKRYYKKSKMASYIVGYARDNSEGEIVGEMGIESIYNDTLKGTNGETIYKQDGAGYTMGEAFTVDPVSGSDIYLTLDSQIQLILEDAAHTLEENYNFDWFTFSVMDAKTGAIVGSVASPNFNPNTLEGLTNFVNPLVGYTYEPGSVMKIFSWLAAMENDLYNGSEEFMSGTIKVAGATIQDFNRSGWGNISYDTGFAYSSNVGATKLALKMGSAKLLNFYESLGFGKKTGIELPGEGSGILRLTYESELASASFGQGITVTPIQILQALSIITNDGVMLKPYVVDKIVNEKGEVTYQGERTELGRKASSKSINKIRELMYDVVYNGLSKTWQTSNVTIAGKTGTAEIASPNGGYLTGANDYIRSFAGIFPYEDPQYIFYVSAKQIEGGATGVAKITKQVVESIANYANLTSVESELDKSKIINLENYISEDVETTKETLNNFNLDVIVLGNGSNIIKQFPTNKTEVVQGSKVFLLTDNSEYVMPDVTGWSSSEIMTFCNLIGLKYTFNGYGKVTSVNINKDEVIDLNNTLEITLST
ncbi:MAG: penicillin-binding protein [Ruminococcus sp.]|nr:penicillin-binding protein [Ruminococcus sp.]